MLENKHNMSPLIYITFFINEPTNCVTRKIQSETSCFILSEVPGKKNILASSQYIYVTPSFLSVALYCGSFSNRIPKTMMSMSLLPVKMLREHFTKKNMHPVLPCAAA